MFPFCSKRERRVKSGLEMAVTGFEPAGSGHSAWDGKGRLGDETRPPAARIRGRCNGRLASLAIIPVVVGSPCDSTGAIGSTLDQRQQPNPTSAETELVRRFAIRIGLKCLGVICADFGLLAIIGPNLVDRHQDIALAGALLCAALALVATIWLSFQLWFDVRAFVDARRQLRRGPPLKVIGK